MSAYIIAQVNITNKELYEEYKKNAAPLVTKFGGKFLVRGGKFEKLLGNWDYERTVVIQFSSYEQGLKWYNSEEYKSVKKIRENNSLGNVIIVEGK
tara:strand:- start:1759 stop:2046 length:288 start_codon:yes stop_codon:yes gene_type:complete